MKKKALLVGCNYPGTQSQLNGCVNDVLLMQDILTNKFGFNDPLNRRMLTDNSCTTQNILDRLNWLVADAQPGDELFFHYSGHGSQVPAESSYDQGVEADGLDEILCPCDLNWRDKIIRDNDIAKIFQKIPDGVGLTVVFDCCHSGDGLREFVNPMLQPSPSPTKSRAMECPPDIMNRVFGLDTKTNRALSKITYEDQKGILVSGCRSDQTSADAWIQQARKYYGALTYHISEVLKENDYAITMENLIEKVRCKLVVAGYPQVPQLDCASKLGQKLFLK